MHEKKIRIVLINPPYSYFPYNKKNFSNYKVPPLGISYLAGAIREAFHEDVRIEVRDDLNKGNVIISEYSREIVSDYPDIVGFSVNTATVHWAKCVSAAIKKISPSIKIIMGGVHATLLPHDLFDAADAVFMGDAEFSIVEYIKNFFIEEPWKPVPGVYIKGEDGSNFIFGGFREPVEDLDQLPSPAFDLFDLRAYYHLYPYPGSCGLASVITSRGCPYACNFCSNEILTNRRMRLHSIGRVLDDVSKIAKTGTNLIFFHDDTFTYNKQRAIQILRSVKEHFGGMKIICHTRADHIDEELAYEMAQNNCVEVQIGVESGVQHILNEYNKNLSIKAVEKAFTVLHKYNINTWATFLLGAPSETHETIKQTIRFAIKLNPTYASFIVLMPLPETKLFDLYDTNGWLLTKEWKHYSWHGDPVIKTDYLTPEKLKKLRKRALLLFYLRPGKLFQLFLNTLRAGSVKELIRDFYAFLSFFKK